MPSLPYTAAMKGLHHARDGGFDALQRRTGSMRRLARRILIAACLFAPLISFAESPPLTADDLSGPAPALEDLGALLLVRPEGVEVQAESAAESVAEPVVLLETSGERKHAGRWQVAPHLEAQATYDDNIFIQPRDKVADFVFTLAPGLAIGFWDSEELLEHYLDREESAARLELTRGNFFVFDCTGILLGFARTSSQNAFDGEARFAAQWQGEKLTLGSAAHLASNSETNRDVGGRIRQTTLTAEVTARYQVSEKTALELGVYQRTIDPKDHLRSEEWRGEGFFDYAVTPVLRLGAGGAIGRVDVESSDVDTFERVLARAVYAWEERIETVLTGGVEFRQSDGLLGDRAVPIFDLHSTWTDGAGTRFGLGAFRRLETSESRLRDDITELGAGLIFRRDIGNGFRLSFDAGYEQADYTTGRDDHYFFLKPGVLLNFTAWGNVGLFYEYRRNQSNVASSSFENNRVSVKIGLLY